MLSVSAANIDALLSSSASINSKKESLNGGSRQGQQAQPSSVVDTLVYSCFEI